MKFHGTATLEVLTVNDGGFHKVRMTVNFTLAYGTSFLLCVVLSRAWRIPIDCLYSRSLYLCSISTYTFTAFLLNESRRP